MKQRAAFKRGLSAERLCRWSLRCRGWRILAQRYRVAAGEIDLIARRGRVLAAIEVKARADYDSGSEAVRGRQRRRIVRAFEHFLSLHPDLSGLDTRFDVMVVVPRRWPRHLADAWQVDG